MAKREETDMRKIICVILAATALLLGGALPSHAWGGYHGYGHHGFGYGHHGFGYGYPLDFELFHSRFEGGRLEP